MQDLSEPIVGHRGKKKRAAFPNATTLQPHRGQIRSV
jgi:hypothetical protein